MNTTNDKRHAELLCDPLSSKSPAPDKRLKDAEILFGLFGWLTSRYEPITLSANHNASPAVDLIKRFCEANGIPNVCRPEWTDYLTHPPVLKGEATQADFPKEQTVATATTSAALETLQGINSELEQQNEEMEREAASAASDKPVDQDELYQVLMIVIRVSMGELGPFNDNLWRDAVKLGLVRTVGGQPERTEQGYQVWISWLAAGTALIRDA